SESYLRDDSFNKGLSSEDVSNTDPRVQETHILQERKIGVFGAISLINDALILYKCFFTPDVYLRIKRESGYGAYPLGYRQHTFHVWNYGDARFWHQRSPVRVYESVFGAFFFSEATFTCIYLFYCVLTVIPTRQCPSLHFLSSDLTIAASVFNDIFGHSAAEKVLPSLRRLIAQVLQELAKDGVSLFPNLLMQNRLFNTPVLRLAIHLGITIIFICALPACYTFNFVVGLGPYPPDFLSILVTIGLIKLHLDKNDFKSGWPILAFYLVGNMSLLTLYFLLLMPFVPPSNIKGSLSLPFWLSPVVSSAKLAFRVICYVGRFVLLPGVFVYKLDLVAVGLSDGSLSRYKIREM
ncbi:High-affinity methionine permease, partial [Penicillium rolfsii]